MNPWRHPNTRCLLQLHLTFQPGMNGLDSFEFNLRFLGPGTTTSEVMGCRLLDISEETLFFDLFGDHFDAREREPLDRAYVTGNFEKLMHEHKDFTGSFDALKSISFGAGRVSVKHQHNSVEVASCGSLHLRPDILQHLTIAIMLAYVPEPAGPSKALEDMSLRMDADLQCQSKRNSLLRSVESRTISLRSILLSHGPGVPLNNARPRAYLRPEISQCAHKIIESSGLAALISPRPSVGTPFDQKVFVALQHRKPSMSMPPPTEARTSQARPSRQFVEVPRSVSDSTPKGTKGADTRTAPAAGSSRQDPVPVTISVNNSRSAGDLIDHCARHVSSHREFDEAVAMLGRAGVVERLLQSTYPAEALQGYGLDLGDLAGQVTRRLESAEREAPRAISYRFPAAADTHGVEPGTAPESVPGTCGRDIGMLPGAALPNVTLNLGRNPAADAATQSSDLTATPRRTSASLARTFPAVRVKFERSPPRSIPAAVVEARRGSYLDMN